MHKMVGGWSQAGRRGEYIGRGVPGCRIGDKGGVVVDVSSTAKNFSNRFPGVVMYGGEKCQLG